MNSATARTLIPSDKHSGTSADWYEAVRRLSPAVLGAAVDARRGAGRRSVRIPNPAYAPGGSEPKTLVRKQDVAGAVPHADVARWPQAFRPGDYDWGTPIALKEAADDYAEQHGMSLASAVSDLLGRGLEAAENEPSIRALEARAQEAEKARSAAQTMSERLQLVLGECDCGHQLTGNDLLVTGHCPGCKRGLSGLLSGGTAAAPAKVNTTELAPLMAAIGVALALILIAYKGK